MSTFVNYNPEAQKNPKFSLTATAEARWIEAMGRMLADPETHAMVQARILDKPPASMSMYHKAIARGKQLQRGNKN
jgi:hypothetical protein